MTYAEVSLCMYSICYTTDQVIMEEKLTITRKVHAATVHLSTYLTMHGRGMADVYFASVTVNPLCLVIYILYPGW